jgi:hypothetical protein
MWADHALSLRVPFHAFLRALCDVCMASLCDENVLMTIADSLWPVRLG